MAGGLHPPDSVVATWHPNFINPETRGTSIIVLTSFLLALCFVVVGLRIWARLHNTKNFGLDDALIILTLIPLTGLAVTVILGYTHYGLSKHVWDNQLSTLIASRQILFAILLLYLVSTALTKISILLFYRRLGAGAMSRLYRLTLYTAIASVGIYLFVFTILLLTGCRPLYAFWKQVDKQWIATNQYRCFDERAALLSAAIISTIEDFVACLLPMILFWDLKLSVKQKLALQAVFGVGLFVCVCGVLRVVEFVAIHDRTYDITWALLPFLTWTIVESNIAVICASAPSLHYLFRYFIGEARGTNQTKHSNPTLRLHEGNRNKSRLRDDNFDSTEEIYLQRAKAPIGKAHGKHSVYEIAFLDSSSTTNVDFPIDGRYSERSRKWEDGRQEHLQYP